MTTPNPASQPVANVTPSPTTSAATEAQARSRRKWSTEEKAECLALFRESGMSQADFANEMKMPAATLSLWLRQEREDGDDDGALIEVALPALNPTNVGGTAVKIHLPGGIKLEIPAGIDATWLGQLLENLRPCSA